MENLHKEGRTRGVSESDFHDNDGNPLLKYTPEIPQQDILLPQNPFGDKIWGQIREFTDALPTMEDWHQLVAGAVITSWGLTMDNIKHFSELDMQRIAFNAGGYLLCGLVAWGATVSHLIKEEQA